MDPTTLTGTAALGQGFANQVTSSAAKLNGSNVDVKKARDAAQKFEGFFAGQMMESMMTDMDPDPVFGGGYAEETWRSMLNQEYGKEIAKSGRLGLADGVMKAMLAAQEQRTAAQTAGAGTPAATPTASAATDDATANATANATSLPMAAPFAFPRRLPSGN